MCVVGVPRSGTSLLVAMLGAHPAFACGPETHLFSKTTVLERESAVDDPRWPEKAFRLVTALTLAGEPVTKAFGISEDLLRVHLADQRPSIGAIYCALPRLDAEQQQKPRWVEKTPNHLLHCGDIRRACPTGWIVRIVRDPRDVVLSLQQFPWAGSSLIDACNLWAQWHQQSDPFFRHARNVVTLRFEDLVCEPVRELRRLCELFGERFDRRMLDTTVSGARIRTAREPWKARITEPLDRDRIQPWQQHFPRELLAEAERILGPGIVSFAYDRPLASREDPAPVRTTPVKRALVGRLQRAATRGVGRSFLRRLSYLPDESSGLISALRDRRERQWLFNGSRSLRAKLDKRLPAAHTWLFILGVNNSGTSLLTRLLESHPSLQGLPREGHVLTTGVPLPKHHGVSRRWSSRPDVFRLLADDEPLGALRARFDWQQHLGDAPISVEKSPPNTMRARWLQTNFRPSAFVGIIRNPEAVSEGIRRREGVSISEAAQHWSNAMDYLTADVEFLERFLLIRYEDLCSDPEGVLGRVQRFLGLACPFGPEVWEKMESGSMGELRDHNDESIRRLSPEDRSAIRTLVGHRMQQFGYPLGAS